MALPLNLLLLLLSPSHPSSSASMWWSAAAAASDDGGGGGGSNSIYLESESQIPQKFAGLIRYDTTTKNIKFLLRANRHRDALLGPFLIYTRNETSLAFLTRTPVPILRECYGMQVVNDTYKYREEILVWAQPHRFVVVGCRLIGDERRFPSDVAMDCVTAYTINATHVYTNGTFDSEISPWTTERRVAAADDDEAFAYELRRVFIANDLNTEVIPAGYDGDCRTEYTFDGADYRIALSSFKGTAVPPTLLPSTLADAAAATALRYYAGDESDISAATADTATADWRRYVYFDATRERNIKILLKSWRREPLGPLTIYTSEPTPIVFDVVQPTPMMRECQRNFTITLASIPDAMGDRIASGSSSYRWSCALDDNDFEIRLVQLPIEKFTNAKQCRGRWTINAGGATQLSNASGGGGGGATLHIYAAQQSPSSSFGGASRVIPHDHIATAAFPYAFRLTLRSQPEPVVPMENWLTDCRVEFRFDGSRYKLASERWPLPTTATTTTSTTSTTTTTTTTTTTASAPPTRSLLEVIAAEIKHAFGDNDAEPREDAALRERAFKNAAFRDCCQRHAIGAEFARFCRYRIGAAVEDTHALALLRHHNASLSAAAALAADEERPVDAAATTASADWARSLAVAVRCATEERDLRECCRKKGVKDEACLHRCNGALDERELSTLVGAWTDERCWKPLEDADGGGRLVDVDRCIYAGAYDNGGFYTKSALFRHCCETELRGVDANSANASAALTPLCDYRALHYLATEKTQHSWTRISTAAAGVALGAMRANELLAQIVRCANDARDHRECCRREGLKGAECLMLCDGVAPHFDAALSALDLRRCLQEPAAITRCIFARSYNLDDDDAAAADDVD